MITDEMIRHAKSLELPDLIRRRNIDLTPTNGGSAFKCKCPFHDDKNPSLNLSIKEGLWLWNCFGCGAGGTVIDFVMRYEQKDFKEAVLSIAGDKDSRPGRINLDRVKVDNFKQDAINLDRVKVDRLRLEMEDVKPLESLEKPRSIKKEISPGDRIKYLSLVSDHFHSLLLSGHERGKQYLEKRGLWDVDLIKTFKLGYSDGMGKKVFADIRAELKPLGIFTESYHEIFANCVTFPILNEKGQTTDLYGRRIMNYSDRANHCYNKGSHLGIFNFQNVKNSETVILTEGIIDALSIYRCGVPNVTALYGVNGFTDSLEALLKSKRQVILALDNDEAGKAGAKRISGMLSNVEVLAVQFPEGIKDANELLIKDGPEALKKVVEDAVSLLLGSPAEIRIKEALEEERSDETEEAPKPLKIEEAKPVVFREVVLDFPFTWSGTDLIFKSSLLVYTVRNAGKLKSLDSLKFVISVRQGEEGDVYTDRLDLYLSRSRKIFENEVAKQFKVQSAVVEKDLTSLMSFIEKDFKRRKMEESKGESKTVQLNPEEEAEAVKFLRTSGLFNRIIEDISDLGYAGEDENKLLLYLCATSRKLDKPISILIRSQSSTGKSYLMDKICELMPSEDVHKWTSLTPKALYYMAPDALKHKFISIDEREGIEEAEYPIRSLQSGGKLSMATPIKNPVTGEMRTEHIEKEGPVSYVDGSTNTRTNPENANRCFEIFLDESQEQTRRVQEQQRKAHTLQGLEVESRKIEIKRRHQNAQRLLKPVKVVIPYIEEMEFPSDWIRTRRDHDRFLSLIVCIAFLHQYQRERKEIHGKTYIEANLKDYAMAFKLAGTVLANTFQELDKPLHDFYLKLSVMVEEKSKEQGIPSEEFSFTRRQVRGFTKLPDYLVKRYMRVLNDLEYFELKMGVQGSRFVYRLVRTPQEREQLQGFLSPSQLGAKIRAKKSPLANEGVSVKSGTSGNLGSSTFFKGQSTEFQEVTKSVEVELEKLEGV